MKPKDVALIQFSSMIRLVSHILKHPNREPDMPTTSKPVRRRAPNGVDRKQVAMRLFPSEREQLVKLADERGMMEGAFAREMYLEGMKAMGLPAEAA
ncbi:hypothetical protein QU481_12005 [Crenobacter sp. SG2303]|uniref:Uncharacterized protein n=1 Tax=Crenobacter oryzisoli TaxID=3056844 RepID=A0ABT7XP94_9NEIS|nr:hypothetical protein [Crenobacter sp. SG2303]MDN0075616.1 hypothetical protein [Crenobacter sp. SG2303]